LFLKCRWQKRRIRAPPDVMLAALAQAELVIGSTRRGAYVSQPLQPGHCQ
jgi:hypothetical protein